MTAEPAAGAASASPTFSTPASICFNEPNDALLPPFSLGEFADFVVPDCASAKLVMPTLAAAMLITAVLKKRRRSWLTSSDILSALVALVVMTRAPFNYQRPK